MGRSCARRSGALRVSYFGRRTGWIELEYDFEETRKLPKSAPWISAGKDRALQQAGRSAVARQRWNRAESLENCSYNREREKLSRCSKRIRKFRRLYVELCWRQPDTESLENLD